MKLYNENDIPHLVKQVKHDSDDLSVVNAARVSFAKEHKELDFTDNKDPGLIGYLARNKHWTPFAHQVFRVKGIELDDAAMQFCLQYHVPVKIYDSRFDWSMSLYGLVNFFVMHLNSEPPLALREGLDISIKSLISSITSDWHTLPSYDTFRRGFGVKKDDNYLTIHFKMPIFVARQWFKHSQGFVRNEVSRRYVHFSPDFYSPAAWRSKPEGSIKQGSNPQVVATNSQNRHDYNNTIHKSSMMYECLLMDDICPEQARMSLSQSMMTEFWETAHIDDYKRLCNLRIQLDAQLETRLYAERVREIMRERYYTDDITNIIENKALTDHNV